MLLIEDGFLRSVRRDDEALSFIFDDLGIYYDAFQPSRLEELIREPLSDVDAAEAGSIMAEWRELRLSKYNGLPDYAGALPERYILVIDQVAGDLSISYGLGDRMSFREMLKAAIEENPDATILVKTHPDSGSGSLGHFDADHLRAMPRVIVVDEPCHPVRLIRYAEAVYTVTSQVGFEALIWGKKVRCFGMPFYAGWGLTGDNLEPPIRRGRVSLEQLITGALVRYPRYVDPQRQTEGDLRSVMRHIALQRQISENTPANVKAVGFSRWKQPFLKQFLAGAQVQVCDLAAQVPPDSVVALWGRETPEGLPKDATILRVEDGFLRSAGTRCEACSSSVVGCRRYGHLLQLHAALPARGNPATQALHRYRSRSRTKAPRHDHQHRDFEVQSSSAGLAPPSRKPRSNTRPWTSGERCFASIWIPADPHER